MAFRQLDADQFILIAQIDRNQAIPVDIGIVGQVCFLDDTGLGGHHQAAALVKALDRNHRADLLIAVELRAG